MQKSPEAVKAEYERKHLSPAALLAVALMPERGSISCNDLVSRMKRDSGVPLLFVKNALSYVNELALDNTEKMPVTTETFRPVMLELLRKDYVSMASMHGPSIALSLKEKGRRLVSMARGIVLASSGDPILALQSFSEMRSAYTDASSLLSEHLTRADALKTS
ncbi:MAG: hypothetical protein KGH58_01590 [Candidatus Micrarchaeota archaeon]|nr:hypothetical protein [Candidatus Micrarchaeota archaeon]